MARLKNRTHGHRPKAPEVDGTHAGDFLVGEDYCGPADVDPEDAESPLWSAHVEYSNGEIQDMESADDVPDPVLELLSALAELFE